MRYTEIHNPPRLDHACQYAGRADRKPFSPATHVLATRGDGREVLVPRELFPSGTTTAELEHTNGMFVMPAVHH